MSGRKGQLDATEQQRVGRLVLVARARGELWKQLAHRFGRHPSQLWRYAELARCNTAAVANASPRVDGWPAHDLAGVLLATRAPAMHWGAQPPVRAAA
jgi:hypothetical protein